MLKSLRTLTVSLLAVFPILLVSSTALGGSSLLGMASKLRFAEEFPINTTGKLSIRNSRGAIVAQTWDRPVLRVEVVVSPRTGTPAESEPGAYPLGQLSLRFRSENGAYSLSPEYGNDLPVAVKMREGREKWVMAQFRIWVPSTLDLEVSTGEGKIEVSGARLGGMLEIRSGTGSIEVRNGSATRLNLVCSSCVQSIFGFSAVGSVQVFGGSGLQRLEKVSGRSVLVESSAETLQMINVHVSEGIQISAGKASLSMEDVSGSVVFKTLRGNVVGRKIRGSACGSARGGTIDIEAREWRQTAPCFLETTGGTVRLVVPPNFAAELDVLSEAGFATVEFPVEIVPTSDLTLASATYGPPVRGRVLGRIGRAGQLMSVRSVTGSVRLSPGI
jgi:hypothetical protein